MTPSDSEADASVTAWPGVVAGAVCGLHALVLLGIGAFYGWELARSEQDSVARALISVVLIVVVALGLGQLAHGWFRGASWARTPTLVWNALLVPVAWSLVQSAHVALGAAVGGTAIICLVAAWKASSTDRP